jgi:hypothetical protein
MRQPLADLLDKHLDHRVIELQWRGNIACRVVGTPPTRLIEAAHHVDASHRRTETASARVLTSVVTVPFRRRRRRSPVYFDDIVRPQLRTGAGETLTNRIYRVG